MTSRFKDGRDRPSTKISPSILSADFALLAEESAKVRKFGAEWLHVDCMDGHFVPNFTIGPPVVKSLRKHTDAYLDCHLMIDNPGDWVSHFADAGANGFSFHIEAVAPQPQSISAEQNRKIEKLCRDVRAHKMKAGVALKPSTPASAVVPFVDAGLVDMVLCMTVEPGFGGQSFMPEMMPKVRQLRDSYPTLDIQVDGGIAPATVDTAADAGANVIVAGSAVFGADDPGAVIRQLQSAVDSAATSTTSA